MSDSKRGAARVGSVMTALSKHGYRCARVSASGQRRGQRREERCIAGDAIAFAPRETMLPHLLIEVGGVGKRLRKAFAELRECLPPGFCAIVVRVISRQTRWYVSEDEAHRNCHDALLAASTLR